MEYIILMDRWPNWIRRSATNREIPDSSSGRSTKKEIEMLDWLLKVSLQKSVIFFFIVVLAILIVGFYPEIATWLPNKMF